MRCAVRGGIFLLLTRIVLGSALLFAGWHQVFGEATLTSDELRTLESPPTVSLDADSTATEGESASSASAKRKPVLETALDLHGAGLGAASVAAAWAIALVQLIGGGLLLVGLLTRLWALLAVVLMATLLWAGSIVGAGLFDRNPFDWAAEAASFSSLYMWAALLVLAVGLLFVGPGRISLDHFLFGRPEQPAGGASDSEE